MVAVTGISEGKSTLTRQLVSTGTGIVKITLISACSCTVVTESERVIWGDRSVLKSVQVMVGLELWSILPPELSRVVMVNPLVG